MFAVDPIYGVRQINRTDPVGLFLFLFLFAVAGHGQDRRGLRRGLLRKSGVIGARFAVMFA